MAKEQLDWVVRHIRDLREDPATSVLPDGQLLERFAAHQDQAAFEALLTRHAPLVLGVCRRALHDRHDVEDAFQAVFLVLAQKAARLDRHTSLSSWLFTVARLVALKMRAKKAGQQAREAKAKPPSSPDPLAEITARELYSALDEELAQLAAKYRAPLVLCLLEGRTQDEAARALGLSLATLKRRLAQGRECLRRRLTRRGLTLSAAFLAGLLSQPNGSAAGTTPLIHSTVKAALLFTTRQTTGPISTQADALATELLKAMPVSSLKTIATVFLGLILAASAVGFLGHAKVVADPRPPAGATVPPPDAGPVLPGPDRPARTDRYGDPLPAGARARLGTVRFRHGWSVDRLAFSPDGKLVASWDCFRGIVLWDASSGRVVRELPVGIDARSFGFSPDGKTLAVPHGTAGGFVIGLVDVASGRELRQLKGERTNFAALTFSHNGKLLAGAEYDKRLRLWDVETGRELHPLRKGGDGEIQFFQDFAFSPDDAIMASAYGDAPIVLWKVSTGEPLRQLKGHQKPVSFVRFSSDGKTLLSVSEEGVRVWEVSTGKEVRVFGEKPGQVSLSRDGKMLASSAEDGLIRLWDVQTGKPIRQWRSSINEVRALAFSPDGKLLASGGWDSAIHFWDVTTGKEVYSRGTHQGTIRALAFDKEGTHLLAASGDTVICQWDLATQSPRRSARYHGSKPAFAIAFAPDQKTFATGESDSGIRIHDLATGKVVQALGQHGPAGPSRLAYAPDGKTLASAGRDLLVRLWDTATGKELRQFHGPKVWIACLAISPDGRVLAAADSRETERVHKIHLWDLATGTEMAQLERESVIESIAFSLDGRVLASAGRGSQIELWEVQSGKRIRKMEWLESKREWYMTEGSTPRLAFSNDGRLLASGGAGKRKEDYSIRVWNSITGQEVCHFEGHPTAVTQLVFSADDKTLASGGTDSTIVLWDVAARRPKREIDGPPLSPKALNALWGDLAGQDAARAYQAIWSLATSPEQSVPFLRGHLRPVAPVDRNKIDRLILDLENSRFAVRDRARGELEQLGPVAEAAIREHLSGKGPSLESRRRLELILERLNPAHSPEMLRILRAVAALEYSRSSQARSLLRELARGSPHARLTQDTKAALERLARQPASPPGKRSNTER